MDFSHYFGLDLYNQIAESMEHQFTGLGDWTFRDIAFPQLPSIADAYFCRCYPQHTERNVQLRRVVEFLRHGLENFMEDLIGRYRIDKAEIVGFSSTFVQNLPCIAMARLLKKRREDVTVVMGGANCESVMGQEILKNVDCVDFIFSGPSLISFPTFLRHYLDGSPEEMHQIRGVLSRKNQSHHGLTVLGQTPKASTGEQLDIDINIELDYWTIWPISKITIPATEFGRRCFLRPREVAGGAKRPTVHSAASMVKPWRTARCFLEKQLN